MQHHNRMRPSERKSEAPPQANQNQFSERHSVDQRRSDPHGQQRQWDERERQLVHCENDLYERGSI